jgi:hypothetical protein
MMSDEKSDLTTGGTWKKLAQTHEAGVLLPTQPTAYLHIRPLEVAEVRNGSPERAQAKLE